MSAVEGLLWTISLTRRAVQLRDYFGQKRIATHNFAALKFFLWSCNSYYLHESQIDEIIRLGKNVHVCLEKLHF